MRRIGPSPTSRPRLERTAAVDASALRERYDAVRGATEALSEPLAAEDQVVQSMPDVSPTKWHLAHTSWFFETFLLKRELPGYAPLDPAHEVLFNSYYDAVGEQFPRKRRGLLSRPTVAEVHAYRAHVDACVAELLARVDDGTLRRLAPVVELGLRHEEQHQELILMDLLHVFSCNPLEPVYRPRRQSAGFAPRPLPESGWREFDEGLFAIGHAGEGFAFDNEGPRHRRFVHAFRLAQRPVTEGEFLEFVCDGGYERPDLWLADGWATIRAEGWRAPLYWSERDGEWSTFSLRGRRALDSTRAVSHVSYYEADAYARWADARLPTEVEWEIAARAFGERGAFVEDGLLEPRPLVPGAADGPPARLFGDVWEWTASTYEPYPGYQPPAGALGEYNGKFMCNQMVLRGGSCVTPRDHVRPTYRNFFYPHQRWQFAGLRLARGA